VIVGSTLFCGGNFKSGIVANRADNHDIWDFSREFSLPWVQKAKQWPNPGKRLSVALPGMTGFSMAGVPFKQFARTGALLPHFLRSSSLSDKW
jgi:hypothetical protein